MLCSVMFRPIPCGHHHILAQVDGSGARNRFFSAELNLGNKNNAEEVTLMEFLNASQLDC